jgi:uncharacterized protein (TIGR02646 family)
MRAIRKRGHGGFQLNQSHASPPATPAQATSRWSSFGHQAAVLETLSDEQYQLCCYSELRPDLAGLGYHIEHVENKRQNPARTFDYANLAASALNSRDDLGAFAAQGQEVFGGHAKGKSAGVDLARFVSCHQADCQRHFFYLSDGRVVPARRLSARERDRAEYTIDLLNLNSPYLITRRRRWWQELDMLFEDHAAKGWSFADLASIDLVPRNGRLSQFFSLTRQFFGPIAEQVLQLHAIT